MNNRPTTNSKIGWLVLNGSGWNHHKTAATLLRVLALDPDSLPDVPTGYAVLVAPISDKPSELRCALVKVCEDENDAYPWATQWFNIDVQRIHSVVCCQPADDDSLFFIHAMREEIEKL